MKKELIVLILLLTFLFGCAKLSEEKGVVEEKSEKGLDDLQIVACEEADRAGTCQSRLIDVGIVMPDECCEVLGVCCNE